MSLSNELDPSPLNNTQSMIITAIGYEKNTTIYK